MPSKRLTHNRETRDEEAPDPASELPPKAILDTLPEHARDAAVEASSFSGPLPPPMLYREYERALPGSAERILVMAEKEQNHRIAWEETAQGASVRETARGQWLGFAIAVACIGAAIFLAVNGHGWVAAVAFGIGAVGLVGRFLEK